MPGSPWIFNDARMYKMFGKEERDLNPISHPMDLVTLVRKVPSPRIVRNASLAVHRRAWLCKPFEIIYRIFY